MRVAVLGMGRMGRALAGRVSDAGHDLVVWNRTPGRAPTGVPEASDHVHAVTGAAAVLLALSDDRAVRSVTLGPDGIVPHLGPEACLVDCSTVSPELTAELAHAVPGFAAMPILGAPDAVTSGRAVFLLGAPPEIASRLQPLLATLTPSLRHYDRPELATAAKLTSNLLLLAGVVALAEAFEVGRAGGLTDDQLRQLLADGPMVAPGLKNRFEAVLSGSGEGWWTTSLGAKDAGLAVDLARRADRALPLAEAAAQTYRRAVDQGRGADDIAVVGRR